MNIINKIGEKLMNLSDVENTAKDVMEKNGQHHPMIITVNPNKEIEMGILCFNNDKEKKAQLDFLRKKIIKDKIIKYWIIMEGWINNNIFIRPKYDENKKEAIIIIEFTKDMTMKMINLIFEKQENKIIWKDRIVIENDENFVSTWNFYKEDVTDEIFEQLKNKKSLEEVEKIDNKVIKEITEKAKKLFNNENITEEKVREMIKKLIKEGRLIKND